MAHEYTTWAYAQDVRPAGCKFVLVALADSADSAGRSFRGQKNLAEMTGQSERAVREHLEALERAGLVRRVPRFRSDGTRSSDESFLPPKGEDGEVSNRHILPPADFAAGRKRIDHRQISHSPPAESAGHEPSEEPSVKNHQKRDRASRENPSEKKPNEKQLAHEFDPATIDLPPVFDRERFMDFCATRLKVKSPMTAIALRRFIAKHQKHDRATLDQMFDNAIVGTWKDLYPLNPRDLALTRPGRSGTPEQRAAESATNLLAHLERRKTQ